MCPENVSSFYENLKLLYIEHNHAPNHILNCDKTGAQAGPNGGGRVLARRGARNVHTVIPNEKEWLLVLSCINAGGGHIPNFYIFKGKQMRRNFLQLADPGDTMAMQAKAWMTSYLFDSWIFHFFLALGGEVEFHLQTAICWCLMGTFHTSLYQWSPKLRGRVWILSPYHRIRLTTYSR
jgi:hypothetical protein